MPYGINGFIVAGGGITGYGGTKDRFYNDIYEMSCDLNGQCNDWQFKGYFDTARRNHVALMVSSSIVSCF